MQIMQSELRDGYYEITEPNIIAVKVDDKRWRAGYRKQGALYDTVYMPDDVFVRDIISLKGGRVNIEHNQNTVVGEVVDVVQNINGIKGIKQIVPASGEELGAFFAIIKLNTMTPEQALRYKGTSGEFTILESLDNHKVDGGYVDRYILKARYSGLALTDTPRSHESDLVMNSEKKLDNSENNKNTDIIHNINMATITPEIKQEIENAVKNSMLDIENKIKNAITTLEEEKIKNAEAEQLKNAEQKEKEDLQNRIKNAEEKITQLENAIKNACDPKDSTDVTNTDDKDVDDTIKNSMGVNLSKVLLSEKKLGTETIHNSDNGNQNISSRVQYFGSVLSNAFKI